MVPSTSPPGGDRTIRVFISSTFRDMHAERDVLVTVVFPELRERLDRLGLDFFDVDLRWGVPETGVDGERANSWAYCKQWIERIEPFFVCLLGQRYGWVPPPDDIRDPNDRAAYEGLSITDMEVRYAVLSGRHHRRSFFYLRGAEVPRDSTPDDIYVSFVDAVDQPRLEALKVAIGESGRPVRVYPCYWTGAGFSDLDTFGEMVLEDLWSGVLRDERYVSKDVWRNVLGHDPDGDPIYADDSTLIPRAIWEDIAEQAKPTPADPLDAEAAEMAGFATSRLRWFQGRAGELQQLRAFVDDVRPEDASRVCVVRALPGAGKSALLAKLAEELAASSSHLVITHFVGATERSADLRSLLERMVAELDRHGIPHPEEQDAKQDRESLKARFAARVEPYSDERRVVIVIDGVNQLTDGHDLSWLPRRPGGSVRIVLSCIDDPAPPEASPKAHVIAALRRRHPTPQWVRLGALEETDVREIVNAFLLEYCKELDRQEKDTIARIEQARNPLYLLVMLHELRALGGEDMHVKVRAIVADLAARRPDTVSLFDWMLERLEVFGVEAVRRWWICLSLGRAGMSGRELSDLLGQALGADGSKAALRIERSVRRYLQRRGVQWDFFHSQLRDAVTGRYGPTDAIPYHAAIALYFDTLWRDGDRHATSELPFHQTHGEAWEELESTLCDLEFAEARIAVGAVNDLLEDCDRALDGRIAPALLTIRECVALSVSELSRRPRCSLQSLVNHLRWVQPLLPELQRSLEKAQRVLNGRGYWLLAEGPLPIGRGIRIPWDGNAQSQCIDSDFKRIASVSESGDVEIRDIVTGQLVSRRRLNGRRIVAVAVDAEAHRVAWMDDSGKTRAEDAHASLQARRGERCLAWDTIVGIVTVLENGDLVAWNPDTNHTQVLVPGVPEPVQVLKLKPNFGILCVAGNRQQTILLIALSSGKVAAQAHIEYPRIVDADAHFETQRIFLLTLDATLRVVDSVSGLEVAHMAYEKRADAMVRGRPSRCAYSHPNGVVFFATDQGHVAEWDFQRNTVQSLQNYCSVSDPHRLRIFEALPGAGTLFVSTSKGGGPWAKEDRQLHVTRHASSIDACCFTRSGKLVTLSRGAGTLCWSSADLSLLCQLVDSEIVSIAPGIGADDVLVGDLQGRIWSMGLNESTPNRGNGVPVAFGEPVTMLFHEAGEQVIASGRSGRVLRVPLFQGNTSKVLSLGGNPREQEAILAAGAPGEFWSLRRESLPGGAQTVFGLVEGKEQETCVLRTSEHFPDACVTEDGTTVCLAGRSVQVFQRSSSGAALRFHRDVAVHRVAFLSREFLAVALSRESWLEIWRTTEGMPTVAATFVPAPITALVAREEVVCVGLRTGDLMSVRLKRSAACAES